MTNSLLNDRDLGACEHDLLELLGALDRLPLKLREVCVLRYLEGRSVRQIAFSLVCPVNTVRARLLEAQIRLDKKLMQNTVWQRLGMDQLLLFRIMESLVRNGQLGIRQDGRQANGGNRN